jgi:hypothetical protein
MDFMSSPSLPFMAQAPDPKFAKLDPGTALLAKQQTDQALQSPEHFQGLINQNIGSATSALGATPQSTQQEEARMGGSKTNLDAIRSAYRGQAQKGIQNVYDNNAYQAKLMKADYMNQMARVQMGMQAQQVQNYQTLTQAYIAQEMGRAQTINSIFQTGNTAIGMGMGGRSPGAGGGAQAQSADAGIMAGGGGGAPQGLQSPYGMGDYGAGNFGNVG